MEVRRFCRLCKEVMILGSGLSRNEISTQVPHCVENIEIITIKCVYVEDMHLDYK